MDLLGQGFPGGAVLWSLLPINNSRIFVAGEQIGVYSSNDGSNTWEPFRNGLPSPHVLSLNYNSERILLAGTFDDGVYRTIDFSDDIKAVVEFQRGGKATTRIQAVIFERENFNAKKAMKWLKKHDYKPIKRVDKPKHGTFLRYRLLEPKKNSMYRTINFGDDIKAIVEIISPKNI